MDDISQKQGELHRKLTTILEAVSGWTADENPLKHFQNKIIERCELVEKRLREHDAKVRSLLGGKSLAEFHIEHARQILTNEELRNPHQCSVEDWLYEQRSFRECDVIEDSTDIETGGGRRG